MSKGNSLLVRYGLTGVLSWLSVVLYLTPVMAQFPDDPIPPPLNSRDLAKTVVVNLNFENGRVTGHTANVVFGHSPGRIGNPPLLRIDLFDFHGTLVDQFNAWHPLWTFVTDETGSEHLVVSSNGKGTIAFPFEPDYGTMNVIDVEQDQEITSVDLFPTVRNFCRTNLSDPDCRSLADLDGDGDVDRDDLEILLQNLGKTIKQSACGIRCDLNGDGQISNLDSHELILLCSRPQCATR